MRSCGRNQGPGPGTLLVLLLAAAVTTSRGGLEAAGPEGPRPLRASFASSPSDAVIFPPSPARVLGPLILRDAETVDAIRETADRNLPAGRGEALELRLVKSRYRLDVVDGQRLLKTFPVGLGRVEGPKRERGDHRTPEGSYRVVPGHESPAYGASFYVIYPAEHDVTRALDEGRIGPSIARTLLRSVALGEIPAWRSPLGGLVLLHGSRDKTRTDLTMTPWTQGCIALENDHLDELLGAFSPDDRPWLHILP